jgi:hypothetical protein
MTNAGRVGVGTLSPDAYLTVGDGTVDAQAPLRVYHGYNNGPTVTLLNQSTGTSAYTGLQLGEASTGNRGGLAVFGSNYTASAQFRTSGTYLYNNAGGGGVTIHAEAANSNVYIATAGSERMRITSAGNVGIGTTNPSSTFEVIGGNIRTYKGSDVARLVLGPAPNATNLDYSSLIESISTVASNYQSSMKFYTHGTASTGGDPTLAMTIDSSQRVGIGTSPSYKLDVNGTARFLNNGVSSTFINNANAGTAGSLVLGPGNPITVGYRYVIIDDGGNTGTSISFQRNSAEKAAMFYTFSTDRIQVFVNNSATGVYLNSNATAWTAVSDVRLKNIIEPISDAVAKINTITPVIYSLKSDETNKRRVGFIAQEIQAVLPEAVSVTPDADGTLGLSYTEVIPLAFTAIKELSAENVALKARLDSLEARLAAAGL